MRRRDGIRERPAHRRFRARVHIARKHRGDGVTGALTGITDEDYAVDEIAPRRDLDRGAGVYEHDDRLVLRVERVGYALHHVVFSVVQQVVAFARAVVGALRRVARYDDNGSVGAFGAFFRVLDRYFLVVRLTRLAVALGSSENVVFLVVQRQA